MVMLCWGWTPKSSPSKWCDDIAQKPKTQDTRDGHWLTMASSRRSLLAALWSMVGLLTLTSFVIAIVFAVASINYDAENNWQGGQNNNNQQQQSYYGNNNNGSGSNTIGSSISVTPRAMVFAAMWTAVLSGILAIYGTVILGVRMPNGKYYACCAGNVHRMTPLSLGAFGGSLLMFANLTLVFAILFGAFEVRSWQERMRRWEWILSSIVLFLRLFSHWHTHNTILPPSRLYSFWN